MKLVDYKKVDYKEFINSYEIVLIEYTEKIRFFEGIEISSDNKIEIEFIMKILTMIKKRYDAFHRYIDSSMSEKARKESGDSILREANSHNKKSIFLTFKLSRLGYEIDSEGFMEAKPVLNLDIANKEFEEKKRSLPFKIELLNQLGFFSLESYSSLPNKTKQYKILADLLGYNERDIAGNIRNLSDQNSNDKGNAKYQPYLYTEEVKKLLK